VAVIPDVVSHLQTPEVSIKPEFACTLLSQM